KAPNGISLAISGFGARLLPAFANITSWHGFCAQKSTTASHRHVLAWLLRQKTLADMLKTSDVASHRRVLAWLLRPKAHQPQSAPKALAQLLRPKTQKPIIPKAQKPWHNFCAKSPKAQKPTTAAGCRRLLPTYC
ncbi:MAG: hypothetical protein RR063_09200, partial [Anaerovoracaceae bacterium]